MHSRTKKLISYYRPYRGLFARDLFCAAISSGIALILPLLIRVITDELLPGARPDAARDVLCVGGLMLLLIALRGGCIYYYDYRGHAMGAMMERDMRRELFDHLLTLPRRFFDEHKLGGLMSHITSDTIALAELYHHAPENLMLYSIKFIGAVVVLGRINAPLLLGVLALLPPLAALALILGKRMYRAQSTSLHRIGEINARVEESLGGMRVVQSYANEAEEARKFGVINEQFLDGRKSVYRSEAHFSLAVDQFANLALAAIAVFGGLSILGGTLALPDLIPFILYIGYLLEPVQHLAWTIEQYQMGIAGYHRFMDVLETQPEIHDEEGAAPLPQASGEIRFENVGFRYRDDHERVLRNLSFHVRPGETVAIVGHSGVGKTTLCALIPRFYEPQEGRITIDGKDVRSVTLGSLRRQIGMVEQDCYLFSGTVYDNILYGRPDASEEEVIQAARRADAHEFILEWPEGYQTDIGPRGVRLSGGQRQRISVARAFLKDPPILILDEATSALDNESESHLRRSLEELSKNRTTLVIAHRLSTVRRAGRILVLTSSGIAEEGTHDDLIARDGVYARLYEAGA